MNRHKHWALPVILLAQLLTIVDIFIVNVAIPTIRQHIHATSAETQLIITAYMVGFASLLIAGGKLADKIGRKPIFILGLALFMITSACCGCAPTAPWLVAARFFQGVSAALLYPQVLSFIHVLYPQHEQRTKAIAWYGITIGVGTMLGQLLGGYFVSLPTSLLTQPWRLIFFVNVPLCILAIIAARYVLPGSKSKPASKFDYSGAVILTAALALLVYTLTTALESGNLFRFIYCPAITILLLTAFKKEQDRKRRLHEVVLIDMKLFDHRSFLLAIAGVSFFMIMLDSYFFILSIFLQNGLRLSALHAGYMVAFQGAGFIAASLVSAKLIMRYGKNSLIAGLLLLIASMVMQAILFDGPCSILNRYFLLFLHGNGVAMVLPSFANIALKMLPEDLAGNASGVYSTFQQLFGAIGIALVGGVFYAISNNGKDFRTLELAFQCGIAIDVVCLIAVVIVITFLPAAVLPKRN